jgi:putative Holliday junction resolvase
MPASTLFFLLLVFAMPRILAIDYGNKRVGLAVTDPLCIIASPLETVHSKDLVTYVKAYHQREPLKAVVVGMPRTLLNEPTDATSAVVGLLRTLKRELPDVPVHELDERFTSRMAHAAMLAGGLGQKARRDKATVDRVSATLILQSFLNSPAANQLLADG